jgi:hypothetical protein
VPARWIVVRGRDSRMKTAMEPTKPNISRIYDYVLGGHHNFEIDRMAAQQIMKLFPSYPRWARLNRWFLQMVAEQWATEGHQYIIDLGSGMPTQGHFHTAMPSAKVLYADNDPVTVAFAREVLGDNPSIVYLQADVREPAPILEAAEQLFGGQRRVAIGCIGIAYFIDDESLARLMRALHDWAAPGSILALTQTYGDFTTEKAQTMADLFKRSGSEAFLRDEATLRQIVTPWRVGEFKPLASWLHLENLIEEADREGINAEMFGTLLERTG